GGDVAVARAYPADRAAAGGDEVAHLAAGAEAHPGTTGGLRVRVRGVRRRRGTVGRAVDAADQVVDAGAGMQCGDLGRFDDPARNADLVLHRDGRGERVALSGFGEQEQITVLAEIDRLTGIAGQSREMGD